MTNLNREELHTLISDWMVAWNNHDLNEVMKLFAEDATFVSWSGSIVHGKNKIRTAWAPWFSNHNNFTFEVDNIYIDEIKQSVTISWKLDWLNMKNIPEIRNGIDILHLSNSFVILKQSYSHPPLIK